jgi:hypothetical protein
MWSIRKFFGRSRKSQRRSRHVVFCALESFERRCLLSVAMPAAEFRRAAPAHEIGAPVAGIAALAGRATAAVHAQSQLGIGANVGSTAGFGADDDQPVDPGQGGGDIPPVIGKVSW